MTGSHFHLSTRNRARFVAALATVCLVTMAGLSPARAQTSGNQATGGGYPDAQAGTNTPGAMSGAATQPSQTVQTGESGRHGREQITQRLRAVPQGWVRIGYDFDNDGTYDAFEEIYSFDLQRARSSSQDRRHGGAQAQAVDGRPSREPEQRRPFGGPAVNIQGRLLDTFTVNLAGLDEPHVIGNIRSEDGRVERVDLGPRNQISGLNLKQNDEVKVSATRGLLNDRPLFVARQVEAHGSRVVVDQPGGSGLRRINGRILSTRLASFEGHQHDHLLAQIRLDNGRVETVDFGSVNDLQRGVTLRRGDRISLLARRARINDEPAFLAEQIHTPQGQVVQIDITEGREELRLRGTPVSPEDQRDENRMSEQESEAMTTPGAATQPNLEGPPSTRPAR